MDSNAQAFPNQWHPGLSKEEFFKAVALHAILSNPNLRLDPLEIKDKVNKIVSAIVY